MRRYCLSFVVVFLVLSARLVDGQSSAPYPRLMRADIPLYPPVAAQARVSGKVEVRFTLKSGDIIGAGVISGSPILAMPTLEEFKTWHFSPDSYGTFLIVFEYRIEGPEVAVARNPKVEIELPQVTVTTSPIRPTCSDCTSGP